MFTGLKIPRDYIFNQEDSVYIFNMSSSCKVTRYGYAKNEESTLKIIQQLQTSVLIYYNEENVL